MDKENAVYICMEYCYLVTKSCPTPCDPSDCSHQASLSMGFFRQEYWSGLPLPPPGDLPDPGIKPASPAFQMNSLPLSHQRSPKESALQTIKVHLLLKRTCMVM